MTERGRERQRETGTQRHRESQRDTETQTKLRQLVSFREFTHENKMKLPRQAHSRSTLYAIVLLVQ